MSTRTWPAALGCWALAVLFFTPAQLAARESEHERDRDRHGDREHHHLARPQVSTSRYLTLLLRSDGSVWVCGDNATDEFTFDVNYTNYPVNVLPPGPTRHVSAGRRHYFAGALGFGDASWGQLGPDALAAQYSLIEVPTAFPPISGAPVAGFRASFFISNGRVYAAGTNYAGELGNGTTTDDVTPTSTFAPVQMQRRDGSLVDLTDVESVAAGVGFGVAVRRDGTVWTWGDNTWGQLGDGTNVGRPFARPVIHASGERLQGIVEVSVTTGRYYVNDPENPVHAHVLARSEDGRVWGWGENRDGELANGNFWKPASPGDTFNSFTTILSEPYPVEALTADGRPLRGVVAIATGGAHSLALRHDGTVWSWGYNGTGQLGNGVALDDRGSGYAAPVASTPFAGGAESIAAGPGSSFAVDRHGTLWSWGFNFNGVLCKGPNLYDPFDPRSWVVQPTPALADDTGTPFTLR